MSEKKAIEKLTAQISKDLIDVYADGVLIVDGDGMIVYANPAAVGLLGQDDKFLVGGAFGQVLAGDSQVELDVLVNRQPRLVELRKAETSWHEAPAALVMLRDITAQHEHEEALQAATDAAELAHRSTATLLEHFSAEMSQSIGSVQGLMRDIIDTQGKFALEQAQSHARHALKTTERLLQVLGTISKLGEFRTGAIELTEAPMDLEATLALCIPVHAARSEKAGVRLEAALPGSELVVETDRLRFLQAMNLVLQSAINLSRPEGQVVLNLCPDRDAAVRIDVTFENPLMTQEAGKTLLQPFARSENEPGRVGGTGLELPLASVIIEALGSSLKVNVDDGGATRLGFSLPLASG